MFISKGLRCSGWLLVPSGLNASQAAPAVVMAPGLTAVKEQGLLNFAERFADAGLVVLVFDYRYFGESQGEPRSQVFPHEMVEDYRNAVTWLADQPEVDARRIGIWGTSYSGGLVLYAGTFDNRVKAVVAQVPSALTPESRRAMNPEKWDRTGEMLLQDRAERCGTGAVNYLKLVAPEGEPCAVPGKEAYDGYMAISGIAPNWHNRITVESLEKIREFDPVSMIHMMAPTALLLIAAEKDSFIPIEVIKAVYEKAREPKALSLLPITHFEIYSEPWLSKAAAAAVEWFKRYL